MERKSDRYIDLIINMFSVNIQHLQHIASLSMEHKTVVEYRSQGESFVKNFKMIQNDDDDDHHHNEYDRLLAQLLTGHQKTHWSNNQRLVKNLFLNK